MDSTSGTAAGGAFFLIIFPFLFETILLQNVLHWLRDDYPDIRWNAARMMFMLMRNADNRGLINQKILELIDNESVFIKNLIQRQVFEVEGIYETTQDYVRSNTLETVSVKGEVPEFC